MTLPSAVLVDVDGTVALRGDRSPYDERRVHLDTPNVPVVTTVHALAAAGHRIVFCSGRTERCRAATEAWLTEHVAVPYDGLYLRRTGDSRRDSLVKTEIYRRDIAPRYRILLVLDDRTQVVQAWRALGLTVLQVAEGNF